MAEIIVFRRQHERAGRDTGTGTSARSGACEIVIFPGVRYERVDVAYTREEVALADRFASPAGLTAPTA